MYIKNTFLVMSVFAVAIGCGKTEIKSETAGNVITDSSHIYPVPTASLTSASKGYVGWVGDVMPYFVEGKFQLFFLHDATDIQKSSSTGQHPIHRFTTNNLIDFTYEGEAIPYGNIATQDYLIGTGSMVKSGNTYYYYYTGHNGSSSWLQNNNQGWTNANSREAIMYATSSDLKTWKKKESFLLTAPDGFNRNDFRDPFVFYNDDFKEYWMLVSTQQNGKGVILVYKTDDPAKDNWIVRGPLTVEGDFVMLECADIFKLGDQYYMLFAEDWSSTPGTHYRVATSTSGPWLKPTGGNDMFDGHHFYAGRVASNGTQNYAFGWAHRRKPENDNGERTWGGNLISHELIKLSAGKLGIKIPEQVQGYFTKSTDIVIKGQTGSVTKSGAIYTIDGSSTAAEYKFGEIKGATKLSGNINFSNTIGNASIGFNASANNTGSYIIRFEPASNRIAAFNNGVEVTRVPFYFEAGKNYSFSIIMENSVVVLYLNNEVALTNRIYSASNKMWSFGANNLKIVLNDLKIATH